MTASQRASLRSSYSHGSAGTAQCMDRLLLAALLTVQAAAQVTGLISMGQEHLQQCLLCQP